MKILVIGLDSASPELLLGDDRLATIRSLMEIGGYGRLESVVPPDALPGGLGLATSQDPGSLGVYGDRDRVDRSYNSPAIVDARSIRAAALWDQVARAGGKSVLVGVPPTAEPATAETLVARHPVAVPSFSTGDKAALRDEILATSREQFAEVRRLLEDEPWDYFQIVEHGLDLVQRAFWNDRDPEHAPRGPNGPFADVVRDYYLHLDEQLASVLDLLTEETAVLIASTRGVQRLEGGFRINEWLVREGLLALRSKPERSTPIHRADVDWGRTRVWAEGGDVARLYLNVKGREPEGTIEPADCERFRDDLGARLEATAGREGAPPATQVFKPELAYRAVRNIAPDLLVSFGGLAWRCLDDVGAPTLHARASDAGLDGCAPAAHGAFVLASPGVEPIGAIDDARLLDLAPTLLQLGGYDPLPDARGRSLLEGRGAPPSPAEPIDDDELVRERLRGLGYIG